MAWREPSYSSILIEQPASLTADELAEAVQLYSQAIAEKSKGSMDG
jgi:hypothetical protein